MSESRNYGALRVIGTRMVYGAERISRANNDTSPTEKRHSKNAGARLVEERLVHVVARRETTIGRALDNDVILLDPTVSRQHARLVLHDQNWSIYNVTTHNTVSVNGHPVPPGGNLDVQPQDFIQIGSMLLQLVAPAIAPSAEATPEVTAVTLETLTPLSTFLPSRLRRTNGHRKRDKGTRDTTRNDYLLPVDETPPQRPASAEAQTWHGEDSPYVPGEVNQEEAPASSPPVAQLEDIYLSSAKRWSDFPLGIRMRQVLLIAGLIMLALYVVGTIVLNSNGNFSLLMQQGSLNLLGALAIPLIPALGITLLVNFMDRFEREPWFLRLAAFLWGAIIAVPSAALISNFLDELITSRWGDDIGLHAVLQGLNSGVTEETVKGLGLLLLFLVLRDEFDNVTDGIVYGALIGAGFAMVENFVYFATYQADWPVLIVGRIVLGWLCHSTFTICFGMGLGYIRHTRVRWQRIVIPLLGYLLAVGLHTVFDFVNVLIKDLVPAVGGNNTTILTVSLIAVVANYIPPFITQIVILYVLMKALAHEAAVIREFLAPEVSTGVITVDEYVLLQSSVARVREERRVRKQQGLRQWWHVKELYQTEIGLAFRKWHASMGDEPRLGYVHSEESYRQRIKRLRQEIQDGNKKP